MADTIVDNDGLRSDHKGVTLHLSSPTDPVRIRKPKQVFPVPLYAQEKANHVVHEELDILAEALKSTDMTAHQAAAAWDDTKVRIAVGLLNAKREAQRSRTNTYRKKVKRLYHRLTKATQLAKLAAAGDLPGHLHAATLAARVRELTQHIATVKREWVRSKAQRQFQNHAWREGKTTKQFFKRISSKFADNILPALRQPAGRLARDPQEKADTLADCWSTIMQGDSTPTSSVNRVCSWMQQVDGDDVAYLASADMITEEAVAQALRACKPDKACGPDRLGNDWYRAYEERLVPLLTKLYRIWYQAQVFPQSFLTADIFCLKKSGDGANPPNYRPLALLNTDYKILTRLLTTRLRKTLASRISIFQNGFVPGRQIHSTIDYFVAAQRIAQSSPKARDAIALLLDFAKAYDSLDRSYLYSALLRHGYPPHFVQIVTQLHWGTTVRFLANGTHSKRVQVTRGIRQGCPMAPLLFILALEPLYQRLQSGVVHRGIDLTTEENTVALRVAGYADDTAVYLRSPAELPATLVLIDEFGEASGLLLNRGKTVAIALGSIQIRSGPRTSAYWPLTSNVVISGFKLAVDPV